MSITGNINTFHLSSLLQLLSNDKKTGILELTDGNDIVQIFLSEGTIINAFGSSRVERLTNYLCSEGVITAKQLEECLEVSTQTGKKIGMVLVEKCFISQEKLESLLKRQIEQTLFSIFLWDQGEFEYEDQELDLSDQIITNFDTMQIVLEASRRCDEISETKKRVPPDHKILVISPDTDEQQLMRLNTAERAVLSLVNGKRTVKRVIVDSGYAELKVYKILFSLITSGLIMKEEKTSKISSASVLKRNDDEAPASDSAPGDTQKPESTPGAALDAQLPQEEPSDPDELVLELEPKQEVDSAATEEQSAIDEFLKDVSTGVDHRARALIKIDGELLPDLDPEDDDEAEQKEEKKEEQPGVEKPEKEKPEEEDKAEDDIIDLLDTIKLEPSTKQQEATPPKPTRTTPAAKPADGSTDDSDHASKAPAKKRIPPKPLLYAAAVIVVGAALLFLKPFFLPEMPEQEPIQITKTKPVPRKGKKPAKSPVKKSAKKPALQIEEKPVEPQEAAVPQTPAFTFFQDEKGWVSINLPAGYSVKEAFHQNMSRVVIRYGNEITLMITIVPGTADWNAEEAMYAEIVRMQEDDTHEIQEYHTRKHAGCQGYVLHALGEQQQRAIQTALYRFACFNKSARLKITALNWRSAESRKLYQRILTACEETFIIYQ